MRVITLLQPGRIVFGPQCADGVPEDLLRAGCRRAYIVTSPPVLEHAQRLAAAMADAGMTTQIFSAVSAEPDLEPLEAVRAQARRLALMRWWGSVAAAPWIWLSWWPGWQMWTGLQPSSSLPTRSRPGALA